VSKYSSLDKLLITSGNTSIPPEERKDAFTQFHSKTERFVRRRFEMRIRDFHQVEDLVQDFYERLWSKAHQYRPQKNLFPYINRIIKNIIINHQARHGRRWDMRNLESILEWENRLNEKGEICDGDAV
tara:strand:- start:288 stop:671 length:384 start_codon:yes stop_codon:yes gene_type:complete